MSLSTQLGRVSLPRVVVLAAFLVVVAVAVVFSDEPLEPTFIAMSVLVAVYLFASALGRVREHPLFNVANAAWLTVVLALWYVSTEESVFVLVFVALAAIGTLVEAYNYRNDTSYLRIDF